MSSIAITWLRNEFRLDDNPSLYFAREENDAVVPVYIYGDESYLEWKQGAASKAWLHHTLKGFSEDLKSIGSNLVLAKGNPVKELLQLSKAIGCKRIYLSEDLSPNGRDEEAKLRMAADSEGLELKICRGNLLYHPSEIVNQQNKAYQVYTPFWKASQKVRSKFECVSKLQKLSFPKCKIASLHLEDLDLLPKIPWDQSMIKNWNVEIEGARALLKSFTQESLSKYSDLRNIPSVIGTSRLSPYLHFGQISIRSLWNYLKEKSGVKGAGLEQYLKELVWREFAYHLLFHFDYLPNEPLHEEFKRFPWRESKEDFEKWTKGLTGYPLVDAGMRELYQTGWMHNRVRMLVASFLVKHLRIHWLEGAKWFWDCLVDADLASNTMGWQWAAGCGPDAAPYFRIFNPIIQSEKFDPNGHYIRKFVPELSRLNAKQIHRPWELNSSELQKAGIEMGKTYPRPIIDHQKARDFALAAYDKIKKKPK